MTEQSFWSVVICDNCGWEGREDQLEGGESWGCPACGSKEEVRYEDGERVHEPDTEPL